MSACEARGVGDDDGERSKRCANGDGRVTAARARWVLVCWFAVEQRGVVNQEL